MEKKNCYVRTRCEFDILFTFIYSDRGWTTNYPRVCLDALTPKYFYFEKPWRYFVNNIITFLNIFIIFNMYLLCYRL